MISPFREPAARSIPTAQAERPVLAYSVKDAASTVGVSPRTIWRLIGTGDLASFKLGCRTLIRADALKEMIDRHSLAA